jgi:hypothetical protein
VKRARGRGSRQVTLGRKKLKVTKGGGKRIQMQVSKGYVKRLRQRNVAQARLVVTATDAAGNRTKVVKPVSFR